MKTKIGLAVITAILLTSCSTRYMYSPSAHNVPVFTDKGDSKIAAVYSTNAGDEDGSGNGLDVQGAYAITKHVAVQASYFVRNEKTVDSNFNSYYFNYSNVRYKRQMFELGGGYFQSIHKRDKIFLAVYAGVGFGKFSFQDNGLDNNQLDYKRFHQANVIKYYLHPAVSFINHGFVTSVALRATLIDFNHIKTDYSKPELDDVGIESIGGNTYLFFEPAAILSYQFKKLPGLRIEGQVGVSAHAAFENRNLAHKEGNFSVGLVFDVPKFIKGLSK
jgi:hypothetical protein